MGGEASVNNSLKDFRYVVEVGNRTVASKIIGGKVVSFKDRCDDGLFEWGRE